MSKPVLVLAALRFEASAFTSLQRKDPEHWRVEVTGVGPAAARRSAEALIRQLQPKWVVGVGVCGALDSSIQRRAIVVPDRLYSDEWEGGISPSPLPEELRHAILGRARTIAATNRTGADTPLVVSTGALVSVRTVAASPEQKRALGAKYGALAVDQESYAWCEVANSLGVPATILRVVLDGLGDALPAWNRPRDWPAALALPYRALAARRVLKAIEEGLSCGHW
ncbi:phosphorylase family protein [Alicyclobacillus fastidiosus]|uniref:Phosphorylase n=1 Tax=Alicyclobacillus fastidiosus TaxID=392011 RepID=A0ABV5ABV4_9BACL|nr:phosphorylase [Alicyclobacillus fastidiosus]WEH10330.1 phosphorylase [Alicyclobacillus fastidiosus]